MRLTEFPRLFGSSRRITREIDGTEKVYWPNQITTAPYAGRRHVVARKYAKACTTAPFRHSVTLGGVFAWAGVRWQKPYAAPKGEHLTWKLPPPVALGPSTGSMLAIMTVVIEANTLASEVPTVVGQASMN